MAAIVIVDTSILTNVLNVPGFNQDRADVVLQFECHIAAGDNLLLPMAAVFETGNHIAHIADGRVRRRSAQAFVQSVKQAINDEAPWKPIKMPTLDELNGWLDDFPDSAMRGAGMGDLSIFHSWREQCERFPARRVLVWSLDEHLQAFDRDPI
ncbi:hypothetical protein ABXN37_27605 [Piscinibacter sakaiensis]|uniref:hypothetical protein n=1 Tax=Piscinibacter sakaiensis TaxID=1547922 RepID=UPI0009EC20B2|nr:hypothetical protein [Piscinibacter sakaiensis]